VAAGRFDDRLPDRAGRGGALDEPWTPEEARGWVGEALAGADWVHVGALSRGDFPAETLAELRRGRKLCLDGQGLIRPARTGPLELDGDFDPEVLRHVDVLKLSGPEAAALGVDPLGSELGRLGVPEVVVTLGSDGVCVYSDGKVDSIGARPLDVADTTGAGDVFAAVYLQGRRRGHTPLAAAQAANAFVRSFLTGWSG